jgi:hypothetical protein
MKMADTAKIRNMLERFISKVMTAYLAMLSIRFIEARVCFGVIPVKFLSICTCALMKISNKITHDRKFALFPGCARLDSNTSKDLFAADGSFRGAHLRGKLIKHDG